MFRPLVASVFLGVSLVGAGAGLVYFLLKQDEDILSLTYENSKRHRQSIEISIPKDSVGILIGRGGANIKDIQEKTETRITFKDESADTSYRVCVVRGLPENAQMAERTIHEFLASQPKIETVEIWVPQISCGRIIGRSGTNIRSMVKASGAKINLEGGDEDNESGNRRIMIRGTAAQIAVAKSLIDEKVEEDGTTRRSVEATQRTPRSPSRQMCIAATAEHNGGNSSNRLSAERLLAASQGGFLEVYVSAMKDPGKFWIQKVGPPGVELDKLVERMTDYYNIDENRELHRSNQLLEQGDMVAAQFTMDNKWYRAMVLEVEKDEYDPQQSKVHIYFVDYGDDEIKTLANICRIRMEFLQLRHQAIECGLAGVLPTGDKWSEEASDLFDELSHASRWVVLTAKVQGYREQSRMDRAASPVPVVDLIGSQETNIAQELVRQGFAVACESGTPSSSRECIATNTPVGIAAGEESSDNDSDV